MSDAFTRHDYAAQRQAVSDTDKARLSTSFKTDAGKYGYGRTADRRQADKAHASLHCGPAIVKGRGKGAEVMRDENNEKPRPPKVRRTVRA